jgi:hypothetical protein
VAKQLRWKVSTQPMPSARTTCSPPAHHPQPSTLALPAARVPPWLQWCWVVPAHTTTVARTHMMAAALCVAT